MRYLIIILSLLTLSVKAQIPAGILSQSIGGNTFYFISFNSTGMEAEFPSTPLWTNETNIMFEGDGANESMGIYSDEIINNVPPVPDMFQLGDDASVEWLPLSMPIENIQDIGGSGRDKRFLFTFSENGHPMYFSIHGIKPGVKLRVHIFASCSMTFSSFIGIQPYSWATYSADEDAGVLEIPNIVNNTFTLDPLDPLGGWATSPILIPAMIDEELGLGVDVTLAASLLPEVDDPQPLNIPIIQFLAIEIIKE